MWMYQVVFFIHQTNRFPIAEMHLVITRSKDKKEGWADKPFFTEQETTSDNILNWSIFRDAMSDGIQLVKVLP